LERDGQHALVNLNSTDFEHACFSDVLTS